MIARAFFLGCAGLLAAAGLQAAPTAELAARTVVLVNSSQPESVALGEFYAAQRGIPEENLIALPLPAEEEITWHRFVDEVWQPLQDELMRRRWIEGYASRALDKFGRRKFSSAGHRMAYLVVCRGVPLKIQHDPLLEPPAQNPPGPMQRFNTNQGAVDSELSLLAAGNYEINGFVPNPLFAQNLHRMAGADQIVKVARLDGPSDAAARHLVTSAREAEKQGLIGRYYIDLVLQGAPHPDGDHWLEAAATQLEQTGLDGVVDREPAVFDAGVRFDAPAVYLGWYTGGITGPFLQPGFQFPPGAIALHIYSFSASSLRAESPGWSAGLVARGAAATVGNVYEPYLQLLHRPDLLMQALLRGDTWGDATYFALPFLSWQSMAIGDPLYRPLAVSFDEQRRNLAQLPAGLAPYVVLRQARLLEKEGKAAEAAKVLQAGARRYPGLVLALAQARAALAAKQPDQAVDVLVAELHSKPALTGENWPLGREAAQLLLQAGEPRLALRLFRQLLDEPQPSPVAHLGVVREALQAAQAAGDQGAMTVFQAKLDVLLAPPPLPDTGQKKG